MIAAGADLKIYIATRPIDFRCGHDGLAARQFGHEGRACSFAWRVLSRAAD